MNGTSTLFAGGPTGAPPQSQTNPPLRILVADGDSDLCLLYAFVLAGPGYQVDLVQDGAAGWQALEANPYSLLITEHDMHKLTGIELVEKLRAARMALPVVMAAARLPVDALAQNPSLHLAATLRKPFAVDELLGTVKRVLRTSSLPAEDTEPLPDWLNQHQPMFRGQNDANPQPGGQVTIDYPETVRGWVKRISHRGNPQ
jgi:DNA-binding response OmpR family regulator